MKLITLLLTLLISMGACAKDDIFSKYPMHNIYKGIGFSGKYVVVIIPIAGMKGSCWINS